MLLDGAEDQVLEEAGLDQQEGEAAIEALRRLLDGTMAK
jgi:hypothetical protein